MQKQKSSCHVAADTLVNGHVGEKLTNGHCDVAMDDDGVDICSSKNRCILNGCSSKPQTEDQSQDVATQFSSGVDSGMGSPNMAHDQDSHINSLINGSIETTSASSGSTSCSEEEDHHSLTDRSSTSSKNLLLGKAAECKTDSKTIDIQKPNDVEDRSATKDLTVDEFVQLQETNFSIKIVTPNAEPFELQVSSTELVQEIHQVLMDREETCHRSCFSLQLDDQTLDNYTELKNIEGLKEGSILKVVEDAYTTREARIHLRHVRDLMKVSDSPDLYLGIDGSSLSFVESLTGGNNLDRKKSKIEPNASVNYLPPDYCLPRHNKEAPLAPILLSKDSKQQQPICVKMLGSSAWNPPPSNRKMRGDLLYIYVLTAEDKRYYITCCSRGFYVNQSTEDKFNPKPANPKFLYHSLVDLLSYLSATFKKNFTYLQKKRCQKHPFERVATPYPVCSWIAPVFEHNPDSVRAEDAFAFKLGYEEHIPGQMRDWNDELQTTHDLPRKTLQERLIRERVFFKVHSDFVNAATRGAVAVVDGNVMALNPGDESKMQMYIWNNIFFSLGYDVKDHYKDFGGDAAAFVAPNNDLQGVKAFLNIDPEGLYLLGTVVVDYRGYRITAQSIIPGILERDQEQSVIYGSIDFGKTVVANEKYVELMKKPAEQLKLLPHKVKSSNGNVVTLQSSVETKGIIGNDGRHYVLDLLRTFPPDVHYLADAEVNAISKANGYPRAHPHTFSCLRQELLDAFVESRYVTFIRIAAIGMQQLRANKQNKDKESDEMLKDEETTPSLENNNQYDSSSDKNTADSENDSKSAEEKAKELVETLGSSTDKTGEILESATKEVIKKAALMIGSLNETECDLRFNADCFSPTVTLADDEIDIEKQKRLVKDAAEFLLTSQIPSFIKDCLDNTFVPLDGYSLCQALHSRGINIRYLGKLMKLIENSAMLEYLKIICLVELISRCAKHVFRRFIAAANERLCLTYTAASIAHFLNCLLSPVAHPQPLTNCEEPISRQQSSSHKNRSKKNKKLTTTIVGSSQHASAIADWTQLTPKSCWSLIKKEMDSYYGYSIDSETIDEFLSTNDVQKISLLRRFCSTVGVQIQLREYCMDSKQKCAFTEEDIVSLYPIVKHANPKASDAYNLYQAGQAKIQQGHLRAGYELVAEALNALTNVYGALHPEIVECQCLLARMAYVLGDHQEALASQHKGTLMSERCNGLDHPHTIQEYIHLALYCFANFQVGAALKLLYRARYLLVLATGEKHPQIALIDSNIGLILHALNEFDLAAKYLDNALQLSIRFYGHTNLKTALTYHLLARTQSCRGDFRAALQFEKEAFGIYKNVLGESHEKTKESGECLKHLTKQAVTFQKRMNEATRNAKSVSQLLPLQIQQPSFASVLEMLNIVNGMVFIPMTVKDMEALTAALEKNGSLDNDNNNHDNNSNNNSNNNNNNNNSKDNTTVIDNTTYIENNDVQRAIKVEDGLDLD